MAADNVQVMRELGFERWGVAGHDRGARVSYRMALDHPDRVERLCILDVVPTIEQYESAAQSRKALVAMYHWFFLAQPAPLPEKLIGSDPEFYLRHSMQSWAGPDAVFDPAAMDEYVRCFSDPETIRATTDCYRAGATIDCAIDEATRASGQKIACPALILWGDRGGKWDEERMLGTWKRWAADVRGHGVPGGHFCPEEAPEETAAAIGEFFGKPGKDSSVLRALVRVLVDVPVYLADVGAGLQQLAQYEPAHQADGGVERHQIGQTGDAGKPSFQAEEQHGGDDDRARREAQEEMARQHQLDDAHGEGDGQPCGRVQEELAAQDAIDHDGFFANILAAALKASAMSVGRMMVRELLPLAIWPITSICRLAISNWIASMPLSRMAAAMVLVA
jgi:haloacetate dehalogenase